MELRPFNLKDRRKSLGYAWAGIVFMLRTQHNAWLHLAITLQEWGEKKAAQAEFRALLILWPKARAKLTGEEWEAPWASWTADLNKLRRKLGVADPIP